MRKQVRVSMGTLRVLGMELLITDADPTTAYLQTYNPGKCLANCLFCAQARDSKARDDNIARGLYPPRDTIEVITRLSKAYEHGLLRRVCLQTANYRGMFPDLTYLIKEIRERSEIPVSVSLYPLPRDKLSKLKKHGVDRIIIPLDAVTERIFEGVKGRKANCPYTWQKHIKALYDAADVFGEYRIGTHLIIGLGETEKEAVETIQNLNDGGIYSSLFAYTPIPRSQLQRNMPEIGHYRRIQLAHYLIRKDLTNLKKLRFKNNRIADFGVEKEILDRAINSGKPFQTTGCKHCNRPYSTETPGGLIYNYPKKPTRDEIEAVKSQLRL